nr:histidine phosphatase family protein [Nannocystis sp. ILAH1]
MVPRTSSLHIGDLHFAVYVIGPRSREDRRRGSAAAIDRRAAAAGSGVIAGLGRCQRADRLHLEPGRGHDRALPRAGLVVSSATCRVPCSDARPLARPPRREPWQPRRQRSGHLPVAARAAASRGARPGPRRRIFRQRPQLAAAAGSRDRSARAARPCLLHAPDLRELVVQPDRFVDVSRLTPAQLRDILRPPADVPQLETGKQFMTRVRSWLTALPPSGRVLAVTHAGVVRELLRVLFPDHTRTQPVGHAAVSRVSITAGAPRLVMLDERRHLEALRPT